MGWGERFAFDAADSDEVRMEKRAIFIAASACSAAGVVWSAMYYPIFGWRLATALPLTFTVIVGASLLVSHVTKNHRPAVWAEILCIIYITAGIQWDVGSLMDTGYVQAWSFLGPILALMFFSLRGSMVFMAIFLLNLGVTLVFGEYFQSRGVSVSPAVRLAFFAMNIGASSAVVFWVTGYFMQTAAREHTRAQGLLLNILPAAIAGRLKDGGTIADHYEEASVLFADMVGSTPLFAGLSAEETVDWLNETFTMFDALIDAHGLEKIKTVGDNVMVAAGVPVRRDDHAIALTALALNMIEGLEKLPGRHGRKMQFRFGIHTGPLIAGVIGTRKFQYDLYGDTVNTASRMESHGEVGRVHVSDATRALIEEVYELEARGCVAIKGKGEMKTFWVIRAKG